MGLAPVAQPPDGRQRDPAERGYSCLARTGDKPHPQALKVGREPRTRAGERDPFSDHTMDGAGQSPPAHPQPAPAPSNVQMPPGRVDIAAVIAATGGVRTHRAGQHAPPQCDVDHDRPTPGLLVQIDTSDPHSWQVKDTVQ